MAHKSGFVSIIGKPNAGKSTLMNALVGERMSIITPKAQTTRHRIIGILNSEDSQIVFSDTPGIIQPSYMLQESMMSSVKGSLIDADAILLVTDINERHDEGDVIEKLKHVKAPIAVLINKIDKSHQDKVDQKFAYWTKTLNPAAIIPIAAKENFNLEPVMNFIMSNMPEHPGYYDKDVLTDRFERFFVAEIIREKIFLNTDKEIPYSSEVVIASYKEEPKINKIAVEIIVERDSQKSIIIGKGGLLLKKIGTEARLECEDFLQKKVFLEIFVKVVNGWRGKKQYLKQFGYGE